MMTRQAAHREPAEARGQLISHNIAKRWSVNALSTGQTSLTIFCDGRPLTLSSPGVLDNISPVQYLLISVASCFALSVRAVLLARKLSGTTFEVVTTGEKALDAPSRLNHIAVTVIFGDRIGESQAAAIASDAKALCTVTNTILGNPAIAVSSRTAADPAAIPQAARASA